MRGRGAGSALLAAGAAVLALAGCGDETDSRGVPDGAETTTSAPTGDTGLVLYVSNQSFSDETVRLRIRVDGEVVVDDDFAVEDQHSWQEYSLDLTPGRHTLEVVADNGARMLRRFTMPAEGVRYAVVDHWAEDAQGRDAEISWLIQDDPVGFA